MRKLIFALLIMLAQISTEAKDITKPNKPYGGTLIWGVCHKPTLINPILTTHSISASLEELIFNRLVRINAKGEIEPDLAESWEISSDGLVYTFHLRKGVRFHDGRECTADDVKFTYDKILDPENNSPFRPSLQLVDKLEAPDKYTFRITLKKPSAPFIYRLIREIAPKHLLEKADLKTCFFNLHPIGTGPFRFKEWGKDNQIILEYNPDYYEGRPYLDKIIVKTYPTSRDVWTALMRGEIAFTGFIERDDYQILKDDPTFKAYAFALDCYYVMVYNLNDPILSDKNVREAIAYGIDRKSLIERTEGGYGLECSGPFHPETLGFNPLVKPFEYNPQKSQELLREAGWQDIDNDGILEKNEEELELRVLVDARSDIYNTIIMVIRQQLQEIGMKIKVVLYNDDAMLTEEFLTQHQPQAHLKFLPGGFPENIVEDWCTKESNWIGKLWVYRNEEINKLINLGEIAQDKGKRKEIYQKIHQLIYADQPACFLYFPFVFHAISSKFENVDDFFTLSMPFYTMKDWHLNAQMSTDKRRR
jgi:peptide/nickel transport system substrate-binding protein